MWARGTNISNIWTLSSSSSSSFGFVLLLLDPALFGRPAPFRLFGLLQLFVSCLRFLRDSLSIESRAITGSFVRNGPGSCSLSEIGSWSSYIGNTCCSAGVLRRALALAGADIR